MFRERRWFRWLALVPATVVVVAIAACGGDTSGDAAQRPQAARTESASVSPEHADHAAVIDQVNMQFKPARVSIKVGETVLIKNSETAIHTGNINGKNITGNMKKGDSVAWTASSVGQYKVTCDYHPQMSATIAVS